MDPIQEASDPPGSINSSLGNKLDQKCNYSEIKKDKALTKRKGSPQESETMGNGRQQGTPAFLQLRENGDEKSWHPAFMPDGNRLSHGQLVCWCWWGGHWAIGPLPGSQHDKSRALARADCICNKHSLDSHGFLEAELKLKSTVLDPKSYPLNGTENGGKSTGMLGWKNKAGKGEGARQTSWELKSSSTDRSLFSLSSEQHDLYVETESYLKEIQHIKIQTYKTNWKIVHITDGEFVLHTAGFLHQMSFPGTFTPRFELSRILQHCVPVQS